MKPTVSGFLDHAFSFRIGQKTLSYIGPKTWNNLPAQIKLSKNVNTFKHDIKKSFFDDLQKQNDDIFFYY